MQQPLIKATLYWEPTRPGEKTSPPADILIAGFVQKDRGQIYAVYFDTNGVLDYVNLDSVVIRIKVPE